MAASRRQELFDRTQSAIFATDDEIAQPLFDDQELPPIPPRWSTNASSTDEEIRMSPTHFDTPISHIYDGRRGKKTNGMAN